MDRREEEVFKIVGAGTAGALTPFVVKKFLITGVNDKNIVPSLPYELGKLSTFVSAGAGVAAIAAALAGIFTKAGKGNLLGRSEVQQMLLVYGVPALAVTMAMAIGGGTYPVIVGGSPTVTFTPSARMSPSANVRNISARPSAVPQQNVIYSAPAAGQSVIYGAPTTSTNSNGQRFY